MDFSKFKKNRGKLNKAVNKMKDKKPSWQDDRFWTPTVDNLGNAEAVIRFMPQPDVDKEPVVLKFTHGFKDNGKWFFTDCPTTWGKDCPSDQYAQPYWDEDTEASKSIASKYSRKKQFIANILVVKDLAKPENNGKNFLFKFGTKIFEKIMDKVAPDSELDDPVKIFDMWEGRNFKLKRKKVSGWANYDSSEWFDNNSPVAKNDEGIEKVYKQLYVLDDFVDEKNCPKYADLKKKFIGVVGEKAARFFASNKSDADMEDTGTEASVGTTAEEEAFDDSAFNDVSSDEPANENGTDNEEPVKEDVKEDATPEEENKAESDSGEGEDVDFDFNDDDFEFDFGDD